MIVTSNIVSEVLHVPKVAHLDYPSSECLRTVSKDELASLFCKNHLLGMSIKTPLVLPLLKDRDSLTW